MPKRKRRQAAIKSRKKSTKSVLTEAQAPDLINCLNDDCLLRIFGYLPIADRLQLETVCSRWRRIFLMAWRDLKTLDFSNWYQRVTDLYRFPSKFHTNRGVAQILTKFGRNVQQLKLGYPCSFNILPIVQRHCINLIHLDIDLSNYHKSFAKFFPRLPKLKYFQADKILYYPREVFQTLPHDTLTEIHLWSHDRRCLLFRLGSLPVTAPTAIENMKKLTAISLNGFELRPNMIEAISNKTELKYLSLRGSTSRAGLPRLSSLSHLEHLDLSICGEVNDRALMSITQSCRSLKHLSLSSCCKITDRGIKTLEGLPNLEELVINANGRITGSFLWTLTNLKRVECANCTSVNDDSIIKLMRNARHLEYLDVGYSWVTANTLDAANEIAKERNTPLYVVVKGYLKNMWYEVDVSPFLVVEDADDSSSNYY